LQIESFTGKSNRKMSDKLVALKTSPLLLL